MAGATFPECQPKADPTPSSGYGRERVNESPPMVEKAFQKQKREKLLSHSTRSTFFTSAIFSSSANATGIVALSGMWFVVQLWVTGS